MTVLENVMEAPIQVLGLSKQEARERAVKYLGKSWDRRTCAGDIRCIFPAVSNSVFPSQGRWQWNRKFYV